MATSKKGKVDAPAEDAVDAPAEDAVDAPAEDVVDAPAEDAVDAPAEHQLSETQFQSLINAIIVRQQNEQSLQAATVREKEIIALICDALKIDGEKNYQIDQQRKMLIG